MIIGKFKGKKFEGLSRGKGRRYATKTRPLSFKKDAHFNAKALRKIGAKSVRVVKVR